MKGMIFSLCGVVVREEPNNTSKPVGELECFDVVRILKHCPDYTKIKFNKIQGYIETEFVTQIKEYDRR